MNEEIHGIINEGKMVLWMNEWENDNSEFLQALYSVYKKIRTIFSILYSLYSLLPVINILKS